MSGSSTFPFHIAPTNLRPGIVWWNGGQAAGLGGAYIAFETSFDIAVAQKRLKSEYIAADSK